MTQLKKPEKKQEIEYDSDNASWGNADDSYSHGSDVGEVYGFNQAIDEMEAYYKPIVEELVEALKDLSDSIDDGTTLSGQRLENVDKIIAKYKEMR
jgi:hypothetical protein